MDGPSSPLVPGMNILSDPNEYSVSYHSTFEGRILMQILNGNHSRIFVGTVDEVGPFMDQLRMACARAEALELALKGN